MANISDIETLLTSVGNGLGGMLDSLTMPIAILLIVVAVAVAIKELFSNVMSGIGRKIRA